jgi:hypothetical protein
MTPYAYAIAAVVIAGTGATAWHWTPFVGPQAQFEAKDKRIDALTGRVKAFQATLQARDEAIKDRDAKLVENGQTAKTEAERLALSCKFTCKGAFDAGYSARRCPAGGAPDPGVRDLRTAQSAGAFKARPAGVPR